MANSDNYKRFAILYVDDEEKSLKYFVRAFEDDFWILTASNAKDGLRLLEENKDKIAILMTDQKMPGKKESGCWKMAGRLRRVSSEFCPPLSLNWRRRLRP